MYRSLSSTIDLAIVKSLVIIPIQIYDMSMCNPAPLSLAALMNLPGKWMNLERKTAVFTLRTSDEERLKLRKVSKYTTKALGT